MVPSPQAQPTATQARPLVSIVLVSWNAAPVIADCLASLAGSGFQVVVVDNASTDGTAEIVAARFPWVTLVRETVNRGFAGGVNRGWPLSTADFVLLLNCDTTVRDDAVERLADALAARPDCGAVGGCLIGENGAPQHGFHARRFPTLATWLVDLWLVDHLWPSNPVSRRYHALDQTMGATAPVEVDQPAAACLMIRREVLAALGGLDERFHPAWFEDVDLCRRIRAGGWRICFVPEACFTHRGGLAMQQLGLGPFSRIWYRNLQRYVRKHHGLATLLACKALILSGMALRVGLTLPRGRWRDGGAYALVALDALTTWRLKP